jgi:hypothetical protein
MNENDLRDCFAMFASLRIGLDGEADVVLASAERCYTFADAMLEARKPKEEGIVSIKKRVRKT